MTDDTKNNVSEKNAHQYGRLWLKYRSDTFRTIEKTQKEKEEQEKAQMASTSKDSLSTEPRISSLPHSPIMDLYGTATPAMNAVAETTTTNGLSSYVSLP